MKVHLLLAAAVAALLASPSVRQADARGDFIALCRYSLYWSDEFDDQSIGAWRLAGRRWTSHTPWAGDFGDAEFTDPGPRGPFSVSNGVLRIVASRDGTGKWRSGLIAAADETGAGTGLRYGYFETRLRISEGKGIWPAFWLFSLKPRDDPRPNVEFDGMEFYGHDPAAFQVAWHVHYKPPREKETRGDLRRIAAGPTPLTGAFHTIGIDVSPSSTTYYLDRQAIWRVETPPEHVTPLFPLVNLALGSGYSIAETPDPSLLEVDYVRLFAPRDPDEATACNRSAGREASAD